LGRRARVKHPTTAPDAYINSTGLARWFTVTERYRPKQGTPDRGIWDRFGRE
jgi:hypothetical protein